MFCRLTNALKCNWIKLLHRLETSFSKRKKETNRKNTCSYFQAIEALLIYSIRMNQVPRVFIIPAKRKL